MVASSSSGPTSVRDWGSGQEEGRAEEAGLLGLPSRSPWELFIFSQVLRVIWKTLQGTSSSSAGVFILPVDRLTSSHPWSVREGVLLPSLASPFPCVSGGMWSPSPPCLCQVGTSLEKTCLTLSLAPFLSILPASLGSPSRKPSFIPPLPFSFIRPNFSLEYRRSSP